MLSFAVLGPLQVTRDGHPVDVGGPRPRRMLAALVAAAGRVVPDDRLADTVWTDRVPVDPGRTLQVYASRLRRVLGPEVLRRTAGGYRLAGTAAATDVERFTRLVADGRSLAGAGRPGEACAAYGRALALWRGEPYADLYGDDALAAVRTALIEQRAAAAEEGAAARLATGDTAGAVADLEALVRAEPYRERRWSLLVLALYRDGRPAAAVEALGRVRKVLAGELGVEPGDELRDLERRVLRQDPGLSAATRAPSVTRPLSTFVGRDRDLMLLTELLGGHRLVTVVGPAGVGKTRLAVEYAADRPAYLVRLAGVAEPGLVPYAVAAALGVRDLAGDVPAALARRLRAGGLLVLDNCEHLPHAAGQLASTLLGLTPQLRVLATSRTPLDVDGEQSLPLSPLTQDDAVRLLADRIGAGRPAWTPDVRDRDDLARIATTLDRLPLALELAAAQTRTLGLSELRERLGDRFAVLGRIPDGRLSPHATLHDAIAWSVALLAPAERDLLLRLWPFEDGFPLDAAGDAALDTLGSLVGQSVVAADTSVVPARYRMLDSIRAYCRSIDPDPAGTRERHAAWVRGVVARAADDLRGNGSAAAMPILHAELSNIRAALAHDVVAVPEHALRAAGGLMWFWIRAGLLREGREVLTSALAAAPGAPRADVVRGRAALGGLAYVIGDGGTARRLLAGAADERDEADRPALYAEVRYYQSLAQMPDGDPALARAAATDACRLAAATGIRWLMVSALTARGAALILSGRTVEGRGDLRAAVARAGDHRWAASLSELMLAQSLIADARPAEALPRLRQALAWFQAEDDVSSVLAVLHHGALALDSVGRRNDARLLRAAVHDGLVTHGIRPAPTYITPALPDGWYTGPLPAGPPSVEEAAAVLAATT